MAASTQTQELCALVLLYDAVLERPLARFKDLTRARLCSRLPVVLTAGEEHRVLGALRGEQRLDETLLYGSGLRFIECLRLRVAFRKKLYTTLEELQADLDEWMERYNNERTHQGRWCFGKTPMATFLDSIDLAKEKMLAA